MIRDGKAAGWLQLPHEALLPWAMLNDVAFHHVVPGVAVGKGAALLASKDSSTDDAPDGLVPLLTVPSDLILSRERVLEHAKVDEDFRGLLDQMGDFGRVGHQALPPSYRWKVHQQFSTCADSARRPLVVPSSCFFSYSHRSPARIYQIV